MRKEYSLLSMFAAVLFLLAGCSVPTAMTDAAVATTTPMSVEDPAAPATTDIDIINVNERGNTPIDADALTASMDEISTDALSAEERAGILFMREEEKLARDVYLTLYEQWGIPIFQNIANSEATHMDAVGSLIDRYRLEDPAAGKEIGEFADATLQELYDGLTDEGGQSLAAALRVGAAIEEIDILDLENHIVETDKADIILVYENLLKGSRNHLRSFVSTLQRQEGESYSPQYLDQAAYDTIITTPTERGRG